MKKVILISIVGVVATLISIVFAAIFISFSQVLPATDAINQKLTQQVMAKVVRIPQMIEPPIRGFDEVIYSWEMETLEKEVIGVKFRYTPAFAKNQTNLIATLEMPEGADASIFNKVLPALISDNQSLNSAQDVEKANLNANDQAGYERIKLAVKPQTKQTILITWEFEKNKLPKDLTNEYSKLSRYPLPILKILHSLPHFIFGLLSG
ncbi:hypothetical protein A2165_04175 [Candidatus Curtissbacteria bacterium RBG_13_40_7]|uniref:Uncharacterized protein n=1 Tax=Candidatus Curtissbacteria bacterium RBG_13_40_7 TaxID=1797706 RepID=A0A1F5FU02_9BACT|nr:MAG: hypothetical protein A2165_04175 [Candidatus Curtissbacteria bacterium RBG_13_40_7]